MSTPAANIASVDVVSSGCGRGSVRAAQLHAPRELGRDGHLAKHADVASTRVADRQNADLPDRLRAGFERTPQSDDGLRTLGRELVARVAGAGVPTERVDPRIARLVGWLGTQLDQPVGLGEVASLLGLSKPRARHLFVEQTGLSLRTYVLWLRLTRAVEAFAAGASLTDAAHAAGFSDSAHLSRTFRRMFGVAASSLRVS